MAAFYLDENIAVDLAPLLRERGDSVATAGEERRLGAPDPHQLLYAATRGWTLLTHNRHDFRLLHAAWLLWGQSWGDPPAHAGLLIIEQVRGTSLADLAARIHAFASDRETVLTNALSDWRPVTGWRRYHQ